MATKRRKIIYATGLALTVWLMVLFYRCLPDPLFDVPYSTVLEDRNGRLLGARTADDEQWRFPPNTKLPEKYVTALVYYEDKRFYSHPGVDPLALGRALWQNISADRVVSGASTISMQVIRLAGGNPSRSYTQKLREMIQVLRLELRYSKNDILTLYAAHAPFGGNVVGLEAASWRYFGHPADELSWAEAAMLAVLPNSPSLMHPGRNRASLEQKRNRLLERMHQNGIIDALTLNLAIQEIVPEIPQSLPQLSSHLLDRAFSGALRGNQLRTTIDFGLQERASDVIARHYDMLRLNDIHNAAALIADVRTGEILAYIGNTPGPATERERAHLVDMIPAQRSTGSILKPILYTLMMQDAQILPQTLVADVPTRISDYSPQNFSRTYMGAVPAAEVVSRSLNVPSVRMLQRYGLSRFHYYLQEMGMQTLTQPPEHYGLTLILGGAEGTLWDITSMYTSLVYHQQNERYDFESRSLKLSASEEDTSGGGGFRLSPGVVWAMLDAMGEVNRPEGEVDWRRFDSARKVAWKTGTSYGNRDAWAIGMTPEYVIGVWVGNSSGEGRPDLTGVRQAGPIMFDLFSLMGSTSWFQEPIRDTRSVEICLRSGHRAGADCDETEYQLIPIAGLETESCPYHQRIHVTGNPPERADTRCASATDLTPISHFTLPPAMAHYHRRISPSYKSLPKWKDGCTGDDESERVMEIIYPPDRAQIYVPLELDGARGRTVFEVAHERPATQIFWHLNDHYIGSTAEVHQMGLAPEPGIYVLTLVDEYGERMERHFQILSR
ncbi:MAG: penicillin-binding protein 1C [Balneolales bacterium]|nr:penicillin-binding protein 1C [Balneolales bacterium]